MTVPSRSSPLLPVVVRRPVLTVVAVAAVLFAVLAVRYAGTSAAGGVDERVDALLDPLGQAHRRLIEDGVRVGSPSSVLVLSVLLAAVCLALGRRWLALLAVLGPGVTGVCTTLLKPVLGRTIDGGFAFPSGHTGGGTSIGLVAALLLINLLRPGRRGALFLLAAGALMMGGSVATSMIALNAHYPTDTVGGMCTAVVVVLGAALLLDRARIVGGGRTVDTR